MYLPALRVMRNAFTPLLCVVVWFIVEIFPVVFLFAKLIKHWNGSGRRNQNPVLMGQETAPPVAAGGAGCAACVDGPNERGAPVWRAAPALSLSLWPRLPVINRPLSESILGKPCHKGLHGEACVSFCLTTFLLLFFTASSFLFPLVCFIPALPVFSAPS